MTDPHLVLAQYRKALVSDSRSVLICAYLDRDGAATEAQLQDFTGVAPQEIQLKLIELFRADIARPDGDNNWQLTEFGADIFGRLGFRSITAVSLIRRRVVDVDINAELEADLESSTAGYPWWAGSVVSLLHCSTFASVHSPRTTDRVLGERITYAIVLGLNPSNKSFKYKALEAEEPLAELTMTRPTALAAKVEQARIDVARCDRVFRGEIDESEITEEIYILAWSRVLSALATGWADEGLAQTVCSQVDAFRVLDQLVKWQPTVRQLCGRYLATNGPSYWTGLSTELGDTEALTKMLVDVAGAQRSRSWPIQHWPDQVHGLRPPAFL